MSRCSYALLALFLFCLSTAVQAQVSLSLKADKQRYLRYEKVNVRLTVRNYSGNTLVFNNSEDRIFFDVSQIGGPSARAFDKQANPAAGLVLGPGEAKTLVIAIDTLFDMQKEGNYTITAYLNHSRLTRTHVSKEVSVEVRDGKILMERNIGLPAVREDEVIKSIRLQLLKFRDIDDTIYCLRAEDDENVYATIRLGPYIDGDAPMMDIDGTSTVHVLLQARPRIYIYTILGFVGRNLKVRQQRNYTLDNGAVPYLQRRGDRVLLRNGRIAIEGVDFNQE